jgi:hypothetical protein
MEKKIITAIMEALETDNPPAARALAREYDLDPEGLLYYLLEAAGLVYASGKEPKRSEFFEALITLGREVDSEGVTWGIVERARREKRAETEKQTKSAWR